ncbi:MAG: restriction endonuclease subunit S [Bacillota bacterium]
MVKGWKKVAISEIADVKTGPFGSALHASDYVDVGTPIITVEHLGEYAITRQNLPLVSDADKKRLSAYILSEGDIVFSRVGSVDRNAYITKAENGWLFSGRLLRIRAYPETVDPKYLGYYFKYEPTKARVRGIAVGQTMASLNTKLLNDFMVFLPSIFEQHAIAEVLSDADNYIASLEKLITKKKAIKQGAMQELLTGKRRLPGFEDAWVEKPLLDLGVVVQGLTYRPENVQLHGLLVLRSSNIQQERLVFDDCVFVDCKVNDNQYVRKGDILICVRNGSSELIGKCALIDKDYRATFGAFMSVFRSEYDDYIFQVFRSDFVQKQIRNNSNATINQITKKDFENIVIPVPPTLTEQTAIATILSDMDNELEALTTKLDKAKLIKQGIMQELLTGRIRLVQSEAAAEVTVKPEVQVAATAIASAQKGHSQQFDDAVMIAGIVNAFYTDRYPLGRKKVQKLLYLLRRKQDESTVAFKKKAAGPYADEVRYKGGEPIAKGNRYIAATTTKGKGTTFSPGKNIGQALDYIKRWGRQEDIDWLVDNFRYTSVDDLELLATVDMAVCDLEEAGTPVSVDSIKHLIATNKEWRAKLQKKTFADSKIGKAINDLQTLL